MIVNLDCESGAAIEKKAADAGVKTIDYDRLTLGGSAADYVSFDNVKVGKLQGEGLVKCLTDKGVEKPAVAVLNGSPTDNNATLFAQGYDSVLKPKFDAGELDAGRRPDRAGLGQPEGRPDLRADADEGRRQDRRRARRQRRPRQRGHRGAARRTTCRCRSPARTPRPRVCRTSSRGDQCMTVYKAVKKEADGCRRRRHRARSRARSRPPPARCRTTRATVTCPPCSLDPEAIYKDNVKDVVDDGFVKAADICTPDARRGVHGGRHPVSDRSGTDTQRGARRARTPLHVRASFCHHRATTRGRS